MDDYNLLITNVSKVTANNFRNNRNNKYIDEKNNEFDGIMTNEAPIKSVMQRLYNDGNKLSEIIFICSNSVRSNIEKVDEIESIYFDGKHNSLEVLKDRIYEWSDNKYKQPKYYEVFIDDEPNEESLTKTINDVRKRILELVYNSEKSDGRVNIYIESNGGIRYVVTMLLSVIKSLELLHDGRIEIKEILSMVHNSNKKPIFIQNTKTIFDTAQISGLVDEFINYGRIEGVKKFFKNEKNICINKMIDELSRVADDIQLCRTELMLRDFYGEKNINRKIEIFLKEHESDNLIFSMVLSGIGKEISKAEKINDSDQDTILFLPQLIKWCLDKSFLQQALTLCAEKTADYLFKTGILYPVNGFAKKLKDLDTKEYAKEYYFLAHIAEFTQLIRKAEADSFFDVFKDDFMQELKIDVDEKTSDKKSYIVRKEEPPYKCIINKMQYEDIYNKIERTLREYIDNNNPMFFFKYWGEDIGNIETKLSKNGKEKRCFKDIIYEQKSPPETKCNNHKDIRKEICKRVLRFLVIELNIRSNKSHIDEGIKIYRELIRTLYGSGEFTDNLIEKYVVDQSKKFNIMEAIKVGQVITNKEMFVQKILYLYSLCKEQRNMSNHATVKEDNNRIAMNSEQIRILIVKFLEYLK